MSPGPTTGPTHDDVTKNAIKKIFNCEEYFDDDYFKLLTKKFSQRGYEIPESNRSQAIILTGCDIIKNLRGTALGMRFIKNNSQLFILPGVPTEMKGMIEDTIIPKYLPEKRIDQFITIHTTGVPESKITEQIADIIREYELSFGFSFLPSHTGVNIRIKKKNPRPT